MDRIDREILSLLQGDARLSVTAIADSVRLSVSSCHRRLRELEHSGFIEAYRAHLNAEAVGRGFQAIVFVTMRDGGAGVLAEFERALAEVPDVLDAHRLFGDPDYLVRVATLDLAAFQQLYDNTLATLPGVQRLTSTLVMKDVVRGRPLPL